MEKMAQLWAEANELELNKLLEGKLKKIISIILLVSALSLLANTNPSKADYVIGLRKKLFNRVGTILLRQD